MWAITIPLIIGYWIPSLVALARGHQKWWAIIALNLFLGWTVLGWILALVWSLTARRWNTAIVTRERFYGWDESKLPGQRFTRR